MKAQHTSQTRPIGNWLAISHSYFALRRYKEATKSVSSALRLSRNEEYALNLKASILTEVGIDTNNKNTLLEAQRIFESIPRGTENWTVLYNRGRNYEALGDSKSAVIYYKCSIELNPKHAEAWKNLGNCYFELGEHDEEFRCYDQALEINPVLPEALASKATSLMKVKGDYKSAVILLDSIINNCEYFAIEHYTVYYWLSFGYAHLREFKAALGTLDSGLEIHPSNHWLLRFKASVLHSLWRDNSAYCSVSESFFDELLAADPDDSASFREICTILLSQQDHEMLEERLCSWCNDKLHYDAVELLRSMGLSLEYITIPLAAAPLYNDFRGTCELSQYSELLVGFPIAEDICFLKIFDSLFALSFGLLNDFSLKLAESKNGEAEKFSRISEQAFSIFSRIIPLSSLHLGAHIKRQNDLSLKSDLFARAIVLTLHIAFEELSSQTGYLAGRFGFSLVRSDLERSIEAEQLQKWQKEITSSTISILNQSAELLPSG